MNKTNLNERNIASNEFIENKWTKMSVCIRSDSKTVLSNTTSNSTDNVKNKWIGIASTIATASSTKTKKTNKRLQSPSFQYKYAEQNQQLLKQKKSKPQ